MFHLKYTSQVLNLEFAHSINNKFVLKAICPIFCEWTKKLYQISVAKLRMFFSICHCYKFASFCRHERAQFPESLCFPNQCQTRESRESEEAIRQALPGRFGWQVGSQRHFSCFFYWGPPQLAKDHYLLHFSASLPARNT